MSLRNQILEIIELQKFYSFRATDQMKARRASLKMMEIQIKKDLENSSELLHLEVEGSGGSGNNSFIPWIRLFDAVTSPSATDGWYVVLLFSFKGSEVFLSLNQGVNDVEAGDMKRVQSETIVVKSEAARIKLKELRIFPDNAVDIIKLNAPKSRRDLAEGYEYGNVCAFALDLLHREFDRYLFDCIAILEKCRREIVKHELETKLEGTPYKEAHEVKSDKKELQVIIKDPGKLEKATNAHIRTQNFIAKLIRQYNIAPKSPKVAPEYDIAFNTGEELWVIEVKSLPVGAEISQVRIGIGQVLHYKAQLQRHKSNGRVKTILALEMRPNFLDLWQTICNDCDILLTFGPDFKELRQLLTLSS